MQSYSAAPVKIPSFEPYPPRLDRILLKIVTLAPEPPKILLRYFDIYESLMIVGTLPLALIALRLLPSIKQLAISEDLTSP